MNWRNVYDIAQVNAFDGWVAPLLIPFFFAFVIFCLIKAPFLGRVSMFAERLPDYATEDLGTKRSMIAVFGGFIIVLATGVIGFAFWHHMSALEYLKKGPHKKVEGVVADFKPMPYEGHRSETFSVKGVPFEYSDFDATNPGFRNTSSHGGPIKAGLPVRIWYMPAQPGSVDKINWIARIDAAAEGNQSF